MNHKTYINWGQYLNKHNTNSELSADRYLSEGKSVSVFKDIVCRPLWSFIKIYFLNKGFLDGKVGFMFSVNNAVYTMNKYVKYYFLKNYSGEL